MNDRLIYRREFFIEGPWIPPAGGDRLGVISPSTEEVVGGPWPRMTPGERADVLRVTDLVNNLTTGAVV